MLDPKWMRFYALTSGIAFVKVLLIAGGYFLGAWLDRRFGTSPFMVFIFICLGAGLGIWWLMFVLKNAKF